MWYGFFNYKINLIRNKKKNLKFKIKTLNFYFNNTINIFNNVPLYIYLPLNWNFLLINNNKKFNYFYLYSKIYFFNLIFLNFLLKFYFNKKLNIIKVKFKNYNNFFKLYWNFIKFFFFFFNLFFFKKLKFKGKGYYLFKNFRNTINTQLGYSHKLNFYFYLFNIFFLNKNLILFFGINKSILIYFLNKLKYKKKINIFTLKGIRFTKQIIYKKLGKITSYR